MKNSNYIKKILFNFVLLVSISHMNKTYSQGYLEGQFLKEKYNNYDTTYQKVSYGGFHFFPEKYPGYIDENKQKYVDKETIVEFYYKEGIIILKSNSDIIGNKILYVKRVASASGSGNESPIFICQDKNNVEFFVLKSFINKDDYLKYKCFNITITHKTESGLKQHIGLVDCVTIERN